MGVSMTKRMKTTALLLSLCALTVIAGVVAMKAFASTHTYCGGCTLGSTPAVGPFEHYTSNHMSTQQAKKQQIFYYNASTGDTSGSVSSGSSQVFGLNYTGNP
jgi:hypothetical protein